MEGLYPGEGSYNQNRKRTMKQAVSVLIKILFAFTGFNYALRRHNKLNSFQYTLWGLYPGE